MKLNEIKMVQLKGKEADSLTSVQTYLASEPELADIIKTIMIDYTVDGHQYAEFLKMTPLFVTPNKSYMTLTRVAHALDDATLAFVPYLTFDNKARAFDADSGSSVACIIKIDNVVYKINAGRSRYESLKTPPEVFDSLTMFNHNLDKIDLHRSYDDRSWNINYEGWVIFS